MSSTILSPVSGSPLGVDPHAGVEGVGQRNAAIPQDAPPTATSAGNAPPDALLEADARLRQMLDTAIERSGGLQGLDQGLYDMIKNEIPRPGLFHGGFRIHPDMLKAAKACDAAAAALRALPVADFQGNPLPDAAFTALKTFVDAQNTLYAKIAAFQKASGSKAPLLDSLAQATQFRASEALNLAATMQLAAASPERRRIAPGDGVPQAATAGRAMRDMAHFMHGSGDVSGRLKADAAELFGKIDALEGRKGQMPINDFQETIGGLRADLEKLRGRVHEAMNPAAPPEGGHALIADRSLFAPVEGMLARSAERLETLAAADPRQGVKSAVKAVLPTLSEENFSAVSLLPASSREPLEAWLNSYNSQVKAIMDGLDEGTLGPEELADKMEKAVTELRSNAAMEAGSLLLTMARIAERPTMSTEGIVDAYRHVGIGKLSNEMAEELRESVLRGGYANALTPLKELAAQLAGTPLLAFKSVRNAEIREAADMLRATGANPQARGEYIRAALDHHVDMGTILEASLRGIPADQLELRAGDGILTQSRKLGQGAANTVHLCTYRGKDGEDMNLVFKPETGARRGISRLSVSGVGYGEGTRIMQLNVAASRVADAIGCGGAIARSSIGSHDGQLGLFMESAPGKTFAGLSKGQPICRTADGRELTFSQTCTALSANGKLDVMRANLMRELSKMEWADTLSGQVDRHGGNYLVDINPETGAVKITGIDNDASFGVRKRGMAVVDLSHPSPFEEKFLQAVKDSGHGMPKDGRIDLSTFSEELLTKARGLFGFNQLFWPTLIDRDTFNRLTSIREEDYRAMLAPCMDDDAVDAAVDRLKEAQAYAMLLQGEGRVVDDWTSPRIPEMYADHKLGDKGSLSERIRNGFFTRDFLGKFEGDLGLRSGQGL